MGGGWDEVVAPATPPPPRALVEVCATHGDRPALGACERCGTFVCGECARATPRHALLCAPCAERDREVVAWEDPKVFFVVGYVRTLFAIVFRAKRFFSGLPEGAWWRPALFTTIGMNVLLVPCFGWYMAHDPLSPIERTHDEATIFGVLVGYLLVVIGFGLAGALGTSLYALCLHGVARLAGGRGATMRESMRAALYASVWFWPWSTGLVLVQVLPKLAGGLAVILLYMAMPALGSRGLAYHLVGRHGLRPLAGWAIAYALPLGLGLATCCLLWAIGALNGG